jgi:anaerobic selenocysteine-containing dehydrogenase
MRRVGPKGAGEFERISWDEALAEIKERWQAIIATHGAQAIMPHAYLGHQGTLNALPRRPTASPDPPPPG